MLFLNEHFSRESAQESMGMCFCVNVLKIETRSFWGVIHTTGSCTLYCFFILLKFYCDTVIILIT